LHRRIAMLSTLGVGVLCALAATATAAPAICGGTITCDVRLEADVDCSSGGPPVLLAVTIGADRVTLDLNGHRLDARGIVDGHDYITIRDGTLMFGFDLRNTHRTRVLGISGSGDATYGLTDSSRNLIEGNNLGARDGGLGLVRAD